MFKFTRTGSPIPKIDKHVFDREKNIIVIYYPKMSSKKQIIETLIHEYQHYLQSPVWMKRYYNIGHTYDSHPYELAAKEAEKNVESFM